MISNEEQFHLCVIDTIAEIDPLEWDSIATLGEYSPFLEYEFLLSLETTGCVSPETGWYPRHFIVRSENRIVGAAPSYVKTHSMGEFVFDQGLAQVVMEMKKLYYPKLVATLPFTPSPGYRLLISPIGNETTIAQILLNGMLNYREPCRLASLALLFVDPRWDFFHNDDHSSSFQPWVHQYFVWMNDRYSNFEDYLWRFDKNQRRNIRRERASIRDEGIEIRCLTGASLTENIMELMFGFYQSTNEQFGPWAAFFLNREWFLEITRKWNHRILIFAATLPDRGEIIAMSMLVKKGDRLFGRYWGASVFIKNLHFELCYYTPIEYAIKHGITTFDPGMGSIHKTRRGFRSREFKSYHAFSDPDVGRLFSALIPSANQSAQEMIEELDTMIPWKKHS